MSSATPTDHLEIPINPGVPARDRSRGFGPGGSAGVGPSSLVRIVARDADQSVFSGILAVLFNRLGELRDRTYENQRHRASGLNPVVAAIVLWNTAYLERAVTALRERGQAIADDLLAHLSPLGWEHINRTGDYVWKQGEQEERRSFRQLRLPFEQGVSSP